VSRPEPTTVPGPILEGVRDTFRPVIDFVDAVGSHVIMAARAFSWAPRRPFCPANYIEAAEFIGFGSLPIIVLTLFTGMRSRCRRSKRSSVRPEAASPASAGRAGPGARADAAGRAGAVCHRLHHADH
jgi:hypothetical protein